MTAQEPDIIYYQNQKLELFYSPLKSFLEKNSQIPNFKMVRTSNRRGYVATWEICDDKIFLIKIEGQFEGDIPVTLKTLFPESSDRIFADWISDKVNIAQGKFLGYEGAFNQIYEYTLVLDIKKGIIKGLQKIKNKLKK